MATIKEANTCKLSSDYCLSLNIENCHVSITSSPYSVSPGNYIEISIFNITRQQMFELAQKILDAANKIPEKVTFGEKES